MKELKGMIAAMPTPFHADESIDTEGIKKLVEHLVKGGIHGILAGGSTGEYSLMTMEERKLLIKTTCEAAAGKVYVIAGCSCSRTKDTVEMARYAKSVGADFALVLPPYYMKTSEEGMKAYFREIGESADIGVVIYHYPAATAVELSPEFIIELSQLPNIVGVKDTAEMEHTSKLIALKGDGFSVINGCEHLIMGTLASGAEGTMGIIHNLVPERMRKIYDSMQANDVKAASEINRELLELYSMMEDEPYPGPIKAALSMLGLPGGIPRKPIVPPSDEMKKRLEISLKKLDLI